MKKNFFRKDKIFLFCCLFFIGGVGLASFLPQGWLAYTLWIFCGVMLGLVIAVLFWQNLKFRLIGLAGLFLFLGLWRYAVGLPANTPDKVWHYNGQAVTIKGVIVDDPDARTTSIKYKVETRKLKNNNSHQNNFTDVSGVVLISSGLYPKYKYGDEVEISCELAAPEEFSGFAYDRYLARYGIYSVCYYPKIVKLNSNQGNKLYAYIFRFKDKLRSAVDRGMEEPAAGLGRAIVLGDRHAIGDDLRAVFSRAGISHITAISGMHISFLSVLILVILIWLGLPRPLAVAPAALILFLYIILIGLPPSAMRAGLMGFLVMLAISFSRLSRVANVLVLSAAALVMINPKLLRDDIGFELSFLAVLGIIIFYPLINRFLNNIRQPVFKRLLNSAPIRLVLDILIITLSAQALTLPIIAVNFSIVSIVAPLVNILVLWTLPFVIAGVLLGAGLSLLVPALSVFFFFPAGILLNYIIFTAKKLSAIPHAYIQLDYVWPLWWALYYIALVWIIFKFRPKRKKLIWF